MQGEEGTISSLVIEKVRKSRMLVLDDDSVFLAVVASFLTLFNCEVDTKDCPIEALYALRDKYNSYDMILSDTDMPFMSGADFEKIVNEKFHIPVMLMLEDDKQQLMKMRNATEIFTEKPSNLSELNNVWQRVISRISNEKKDNEADKHKADNCSNEVNTQPLEGNKELLSENNDSQSSCNGEGQTSNGVEQGNSSKNSKKSRMTWSVELHTKFVEAINAIGYHRAVPKKIMEYMNEPGITHAHISSHLQKYRMYQRKLHESSTSQQYGMPTNRSTRPLNQYTTLTDSNYLLHYSNSLNQNQQKASVIPSDKARESSSITPSLVQSSNDASQGLNLNNTVHSGDTANNTDITCYSDLDIAAMQFLNPKHSGGSSTSQMITSHGAQEQAQHPSNLYSGFNPFEVNRNNLSSPMMANYGGGGMSSASSQPPIVHQGGSPYFDGSQKNIGYGNIQRSGTLNSNVIHNQFMPQLMNMQYCNLNNNVVNPLCSMSDMLNLNNIADDQKGSMPYSDTISATAQPVFLSTMNQLQSTPNNNSNISGNNISAEYNARNNANEVISSPSVHEQEMSGVEFSSAIATQFLPHDWPPNNIEDFLMDNGFDDLSEIAQNPFDSKNAGSNNQLP